MEQTPSTISTAAETKKPELGLFGALSDLISPGLADRITEYRGAATDKPFGVMTPGDGFRLLEQGEIVASGDEARFENTEGVPIGWFKSTPASKGTVVGTTLVVYRRRV